MSNGKPTVFKWTKVRNEAAVLLAQGYTQEKTAEMVGVAEKTIWTWYQKPAFSEEVDRLSVMVGIASRAERLRIAARVIRQAVQKETGEIKTTKDALDWLKFAQSETDGAKLDLTTLLEGYQADDSNG